MRTHVALVLASTAQSVLGALFTTNATLWRLPTLSGLKRPSACLMAHYWIIADASQFRGFYDYKICVNQRHSRTSPKFAVRGCFAARWRLHHVRQLERNAQRIRVAGSAGHEVRACHHHWGQPRLLPVPSEPGTRHRGNARFRAEARRAERCVSGERTLGHRVGRQSVLSLREPDPANVWRDGMEQGTRARDSALLGS